MSPAPAPPASSRRDLLHRGAATGTAGAVGLGVAGTGRAAAAKGRHRGHRYQGATLLSSADRHLVTRFSYGLTPGLTRSVRRAGGAHEWFEAQLRPDRIDDRATDQLLDWWPSLTFSAGRLWDRQQNGVEGGWEVMASYQRWLLIRRIRTKRQVAEIMAEFWMHHLNVPVNHDATFTHRFDYDRVVRRYALGRFEDLLLHTTTHPAMGVYLDNAVSTRLRPNENLGRELLELHTVGRDGYDEDDVKDSARILTGYLVDMWDTWAATYSRQDHATGPVRVLGFHSANADPDGRAVVKAYLRYLARHPRTAERIARRLCVKFVKDDPPQALVNRLAAVYLKHDTDIRPVLRALVTSREFRRSAGKKVRDPGEDVVATYRALGVSVRRPRAGADDGAASAILWQTQAVGQAPFTWPRPDGQPVDNESWSSAARLLASMDVHWSMSGGWWPSRGIHYRSPRGWLPRERIRFDVLVDHLSQRLLGRHAGAALLQACVQVLPDDWRVRPSTVITADHALVKWGFNRVLSTILDSPQHLSR